MKKYSVDNKEIRNKKYLLEFSREKTLQLLIKKKSPVIFDVGAHIGQSITFFRKIFPDSIIHAFEPDPESFSELKKHKNNKTFINNVAVHSTNDHIKFYKNKISHTNSLYPVNANSKDSITLTNARKEKRIDNIKNEYNREIKVDTITLENYINSFSVQHIDILKIDTQGNEDNVLLGLGTKLEIIDLIITELVFFDYYSKKLSFYEIEKIIAPFNFELYDISDISKNPMNGRTDWVDIIYLKK